MSAAEISFSHHVVQEGILKHIEYHGNGPESKCNKEDEWEGRLKIHATAPGLDELVSENKVGVLKRNENADAK